MQNSVVIFTLFDFGHNYPFLVNVVIWKVSSQKLSENIYLLKLNNQNFKERYEMFSKLAIKAQVTLD